MRALGRNLLQRERSEDILNVSAQLMGPAVNFDLRRGPRLREFASLRQTWVVGILFAALIAAQALGFLVLGTGPGGPQRCLVQPRSQ
jgi:hypothetical protein